ncbi:MAG: glycosyltransferase family 39 protein [Chloroflexi bacterium]|nr:glycosyltransferase family 39 protein [Chloroflexota bacterium]
MSSKAPAAAASPRPLAESTLWSLQVDRMVWMLLGVALLLRLLVMLIFFRAPDPILEDGDFYISIAQDIGRLFFPADPLMAVTSIGPIYPFFLWPFFNIPPDQAVNVQFATARIAQALVDTTTVFFVYMIARQLFGETVGRVALIAQALDVRYLFVAGTITTEPLYIALMASFFALLISTQDKLDLRLFRWLGLLLGIAVLTRPVPLLFPAVLFALAWLNREKRLDLLRGFGWMTAIMVIVILPYTVRTMIVSDEAIPVVDTAAAHFFARSREDGHEIDFIEAQQEEIGYGADNPNVEGAEFLEAGFSNILDAPLTWLANMGRDVLRAYVQPYGTVILTPGDEPAVRELAQSWLRGEIGLGELIGVAGFWRRLLMYAFHFWSLLFGLVGAGLLIAKQDQQLNRAAPLLVWIVYGTLISAPLLIEPRYVFPLMFAFTVLAAYASVTLVGLLFKNAQGFQLGQAELSRGH